MKALAKIALVVFTLVSVSACVFPGRGGGGHEDHGGDRR